MRKELFIHLSQKKPADQRILSSGKVFGIAGNPRHSPIRVHNPYDESYIRGVSLK